MLKKIPRQAIVFLLVSLFAISYPLTAWADDEINAVFTINKSTYTANRLNLTLDVVPYLKTDKPFLPLRFLAYAAGFSAENIKWEPTTGKITLAGNAETLEFVVGKQFFQKNQDTFEMDVVPEIQEGRVMLPARSLSKAFGLNLSWNPITQTVSLGNDNAKFYWRQGYDLIDTGSYDLAILTLEKALTKEPNMAHAYNEMGYAYNLLGQYEKGIESFSRALGLDIKLASAYYNRGFSYAMIGYTENAIRDYTRAIEYGLRSPAVYNSRGSLFSQTGMYPEALYDFNEAIELDPAYPPSYYNRGYVYEQLGQNQQAQADYKLYLQLKGGN